MMRRTETPTIAALALGLLAVACDQDTGRSSPPSQPSASTGGSKSDDADSTDEPEDRDDGAGAVCASADFYCDGSVSINCTQSQDRFDCSIFDTACDDGHCDCDKGQEACTADGERAIHWYCDEQGVENWREVCQPGYPCIVYGSIEPGCVGPDDRLVDIARTACLDYLSRSPCSEEDDDTLFDWNAECTLDRELSPTDLATYVDGLRACGDQAQPLCYDARECHWDLVAELGS